MRACTLCRKLLADDAAVCPDDAAASIEVLFESLPTSLAVRFPDLKPLALGATGTLYLVSSAEGATPVTKLLKVLAKSLTRSAAERATYRRELRRQINLSHPYVPAVIEEGESEERAWLLREYVSGESLAVSLRRRDKPTESLVYAWIAQLADALDALHRLGITHGDVKPSHVLLSEGARGLDVVHLIDAALAAPLAPEKASIRGTAEYIAPEVIDGAAPTFRSDLYALGCLSYQLLAGAPPFQGVTQAATLAAHRESQAPELPATVPQSLRRLIASMLEKDPRRRPFSAQQVKRTVETLLAASAAAASSGGRSRPQPPAAALRAAPGAAKSQAPALSRDATVELDVKDLDEAIDASDATPERTQPLHSVELVEGRTAAGGPESESKTPPKAAALVDDDAPTIALATLNAKEVLADVHRASRSAASGSGTPKSSVTGTHFGLGPVRAQDVAAAAAAAAAGEQGAHAAVSAPARATPADPEPAQVPETAHASALPAALGASKRSGFAPVTAGHSDCAQTPAARTNAATQLPLTRRPSILLWASAGLLAVVLMLRLVFGPGHARTSQSVVVRVPDAPTEPVASAPVAGLSERGLIGGNLNQQVYTRVEAQVRTSVTSEPVVQPVAVAAVAPASADHPAPGVASGRRAVDEPNEPDEPQATDAANGARPAVPTVSAAQVGRSLARAAQTRASGAAEVDYKVRGRELYQAGKFREAAEAYQRATERNGSDAGAYAGMGASFLAAGDAGRAVTAYKRAVQIEPAVSGFQAALGRAYLKKGDRTQARAAYAKALTLDPNNQAAKTGMASAKVR